MKMAFRYNNKNYAGINGSAITVAVIVLCSSVEGQ